MSGCGLADLLRLIYSSAKSAGSRSPGTASVSSFREVAVAISKAQKLCEVVIQCNTDSGSGSRFQVPRSLEARG
jgi:hypothetical protein